MINTKAKKSTYSISDVSKLCGLPDSTLRYYETIGISNPISRDTSSKQRVYSEDDLNLFTSIACLNATGMSLENMRKYLSNHYGGATTAPTEISLLEEQKKILNKEAKFLKIRQQYIDLKIAYWQAVMDGNANKAKRIGGEASALAKDLQLTKNN